MSTKLQQEVWALQRCSGCGACVAACSKGVLHWGLEQHPLLEERQKVLGLSHLKLRTCEVCDRFCELVCPRLTTEGENGTDMPELEAIGVSSARAVGVERSGATSAVIRSLLVAAYSAGLIDGAVVVDVDLWSLEPVARIVTNVEEIVSVVGPHYLWAPVLSALNEAIFERGLRQLAVVGSPCVAQGARRLVSAKNQRLWPYREAIRVTIAQFCTGVYAPDVVSDLVERRHGIARHLIQDLTVSATDGALCVTLWDGSVRNVPLTEVEAFARAGCGSCDDYLGEWADVAVGSVGALAEHATLITRTPAGELLCQNARRFGLLETNPRVDRAALDAAKAEKDRRARAQAYDKLRILMLDALSDPQKRAQVRKQFVSLYGSARAEVAKKEECYGSCSGC